MSEAMRPLFVFVRLRARDGCEPDVTDAVTKVVTASRAEPGCLRMNGFRALRDSRLFFIQSVWSDEAAFDLHATLLHTVAFIETVDKLLEEPREVVRTMEIV